VSLVTDCMCLVRVRLVCFVGKGLLCIFTCFCVSLDHFGFVLSLLLGLFFSVPSQQIGFEERLRNDIFFLSNWTWNDAPSVHPVKFGYNSRLLISCMAVGSTCYRKILHTADQL